MTAAIVAAAGAGTRMNDQKPKVFLDLAGRPIIYYSLKTFSDVSDIDRIILAIPPNWQSHTEEVLSKYGLKNILVIEGCATRQETVYKALQMLPNSTKTVIVHDGARPLVSKNLIESVLDSAKEHGACIPCLPIEETIKLIRGERVVETLNRSEIQIVQTPQAFYYEILLEAHRHAQERKLRVTDDATLIEKIGRPVIAIQGDPKNIKITHQSDLKIAEMFLQ